VNCRIVHTRLTIRVYNKNLKAKPQCITPQSQGRQADSAFHTAQHSTWNMKCQHITVGRSYRRARNSNVAHKHYSIHCAILYLVLNLHIENQSVSFNFTSKVVYLSRIFDHSQTTTTNFLISFTITGYILPQHNRTCSPKIYISIFRYFGCAIFLTYKI